MGQYYTPMIIDMSGHISTLSSYTFNNGSKLMEHSWICNDFVNAVYSLIRRTPKKIAWIGDYSDDLHDDDAYAKALSKEEFMQYYQVAWPEKDDDQREVTQLPLQFFSKEDLDILNFHTAGMYLINHDTQEYLALSDYIRECGIRDEEGYDWCVNPLPLLTACGNDRGGGDFHNGYIGFEDVGIWAFNLLEYTDTVPDGFTEVRYKFMEKKADVATCQ